MVKGKGKAYYALVSSVENDDLDTMKRKLGLQEMPQRKRWLFILAWLNILHMQYLEGTYFIGAGKVYAEAGSRAYQKLANIGIRSDEITYLRRVGKLMDSVSQEDAGIQKRFSGFIFDAIEDEFQLPLVLVGA